MKRILMITLVLMVGAAASLVALGADKEGQSPAGSTIMNPCTPGSGTGPGLKEPWSQGQTPPASVSTSRSIAGSSMESRLKEPGGQGKKPTASAPADRSVLDLITEPAGQGMQHQC